MPGGSNANWDKSGGGRGSHGGGSGGGSKGSGDSEAKREPSLPLSPDEEDKLEGKYSSRLK